MRTLLWLLLACCGFVSAFAPTQTFSVPFLLALTGLLMATATGGVRVDKNTLILFLLFSIPACISAAVNIEYSSSKTIGHLVSYIVTPIAYYVTANSLLQATNLCPSKPILVGLVGSLIYTILEFLAANTGHLQFLLNLPRPAVQDYQPLVAGAIVRARGLTEESAHFMLYAGIFLFVCHHYGKARLIINTLFAAASIATFGVASWIALAASLAMTNARQILSLRLMIVLAPAALAIYATWEYFSTLVLHQFLFKVSNLFESDRVDRMLENLDVYLNGSIANIFLGLGPGYYERLALPSTVSLPALTLFQNGILGLVMLVSMFVVYYFRANKVSKHLAGAVIFAGICYISISNYWLPWVWILFALIDHENRIHHNRT